MIALLAAIALTGAQDARTVCQPNAAGQVVCTTREEPRTAARCAGWDWLIAGCTVGEHNDAVRQRDAARTASELRPRVIALLRADRCEEAINLALDGGDLTLAREARDYCRP